jgi:hypothetical protein
VFLFSREVLFEWMDGCWIVKRIEATTTCIVWADNTDGNWKEDKHREQS